MRSLLRTCSLLAGGTLVIAACSDPDLKTDLDTEGPPEVNTVTVSNEGDPLLVNGGDFFEAPTFCRTNGGRLHREICPKDEAGNVIAVAPVTNVNPDSWLVRFVFSELIATTVEELVDDGTGVLIGTIANTQPVTITCGGAAVTGYDGHYDPSGNDVSAPPGPSLVVNVAGLAAATGSDCEISLVPAVVKDKDNNAIPGGEAGPYNFTIANLHLAGSDPAPAFDDAGNLVPVEGVAPVDDDGAPTALAIAFNAPIDGASITEADITLTLEDDTVVLASFDFAGDVVLITPDAGFLGETTYKLTLLAGSEINDATGGGVYDAPAEDFVVLFTTDALPAAPDASVDAAP